MKTKILLVLACGVVLCGCSSPSPKPSVESAFISEEAAKKSAEFIREHSGLIRNGISAIVQYFVYKTPEGYDRQRIISQINVISSNLSDLLSKGQFNAEQVRQSLKIYEKEATPVMIALATIIDSSIEDLQKNGYGDLSIEIVKATLAGISDGTNE